MCVNRFAWKWGFETFAQSRVGQWWDWLEHHVQQRDLRYFTSLVTSSPSMEKVEDCQGQWRRYHWDYRHIKRYCGWWVDFFKNNSAGNLTVQSACSSSEQALGTVFASAFQILQELTEQELSQEESQFAQATEDSKEESKHIQSPAFWSSRDDATKPNVVSIEGIRFFKNPAFFRYFAQAKGCPIGRSRSYLKVCHYFVHIVLRVDTFVFRVYDLRSPCVTLVQTLNPDLLWLVAKWCGASFTCNWNCV